MEKVGELGNINSSDAQLAEFASHSDLGCAYTLEYKNSYVLDPYIKVTDTYELQYQTCCMEIHLQEQEVAKIIGNYNQDLLSRSTSSKIGIEDAKQIASILRLIQHSAVRAKWIFHSFGRNRRPLIKKDIENINSIEIYATHPHSKVAFIHKFDLTQENYELALKELREIVNTPLCATVSFSLSSFLDLHLNAIKSIAYERTEDYLNCFNLSLRLHIINHIVDKYSARKMSVADLIEIMECTDNRSSSFIMYLFDCKRRNYLALTCYEREQLQKFMNYIEKSTSDILEKSQNGNNAARLELQRINRCLRKCFSPFANLEEMKREISRDKYSVYNACLRFISLNPDLPPLFIRTTNSIKSNEVYNMLQIRLYSLLGKTYEGMHMENLDNLKLKCINSNNSDNRSIPIDLTGIESLISCFSSSKLCVHRRERNI